VIHHQQRIIVDVVGLPVFIGQPQIVVTVPRNKLIAGDTLFRDSIGRRHVGSGDRIVARAGTRERRVCEDERAAASDRLANLTAREREILAPVAAGKQNVEIAAQFGISPRTVEVHKARIMEKLGCRTLAELIRKIGQLIDISASP